MYVYIYTYSSQLETLIRQKQEKINWNKANATCQGYVCAWNFGHACYRVASPAIWYGFLSLGIEILNITYSHVIFEILNNMTCG